MKNTKKLAALALSVLMASSAMALVSCGGGEDKVYVASESGATICYDNFNSGYINAKDTKYQLVLAEGVSADVSVKAYTNEAVYSDGYNDKGKVVIDREYKEVDIGAVAEWDKGTNTFTAKAEGSLIITLSATNGNVLDTVTVDVTPAYVENPDNQFSTQTKDYDNNNSSLMGNTHDPSLIEVKEEDGLTAYYMVSTGWSTGNDIRKSYDLVHWKYMGKTFNANTEMDDVYAWLRTSGATPSWWAPDVVPAADGGYWLYTCVVDGTEDGVNIDGELFTTACILLFHSDTMDAGSFEYKGVLMQSCIYKDSRGNIDVNSIDPQIIYTDDGRMWMAYGSFGTGNYILELNPKTGLRKDNFYKNGKFLEWDKVREYSDEAILLYENYKCTDEDPDGEKIAWSTDYYGKNISRGAMEAPVIARHDDVEILDDSGNVVSTQTYYYSMHSYDALATNYSMWGGRSTSVDGIYRSVRDLTIENGNSARTGNQYMSAIEWEDKVNYCMDPILPGHNDLFSTSNGKHMAAYITRTKSYMEWGTATHIPFVTQIHQYYLNSKGDICINANRYGGETNRCVTKEELMHYTVDNQFKMIVLDGKGGSVSHKSKYVTLNDDGTLSGAYTGTWSMFGDNYIKVKVDGVDTYYGVVTPSWLDDQDCFGFSISAMGQTKGYAMFMNAVSTLA